MEHIRVDYALITQALEHAALLLQMPQAQLFLKVARFNNAAGFFRRVRTIFTNGVQVAVHTRVVHLFVGNAVDNPLWCTNFLADLSHRVEGLSNYRADCFINLIFFGGINRNFRPPNNERQEHPLNHHRQQNHARNNKDNKVTRGNISRHGESHREGNTAAQSRKGTHYTATESCAQLLLLF